MAKSQEGHVLRDEESREAILKRLKRAHGQLGGVIRMIEENRSCEDVIAQMSAVDKAVTTAAFTMLSASLTECITEPGGLGQAETVRLQRLFLSLA